MWDSYVPKCVEALHDTKHAMWHITVKINEWPTQ